MPVSGPGQGSPWSASRPAESVPLECFLKNGVSSLPVALVPTDGGAIRLSETEVFQEELRNISGHFLDISEVRRFGKTGILCRSSNIQCLTDLLAATRFAFIAVRAFIPPHLACVKGIVRGVPTNISPEAFLKMVSPAGVTSVYRCTRPVGDTRVPTESVIVTFAGLTRPSELKAWPYLFRVEALTPRPLQCRNCWRFGHSANACRSSLRCANCGGAHAASNCQVDNCRCCLCDGAHTATDNSCPARERETQILDIMEKRRCSRSEATSFIKEREVGYAAATSRQCGSIEATVASAVSAAIDKAMPMIMERLFNTFAEGLTEMLAARLNSLIPSFAAHTVTVQGEAEHLDNEQNNRRQEDVTPETLVSTQSPTPVGPSGSFGDMRLGNITHKRRNAPLSPTSLPMSKPKKVITDTNNEQDVLRSAVESTILSPS